MDHSHGQSLSTPWNPNLSYAIDWSIALGVPIVFMTGRHLVVLLKRAAAERRQRERTGRTGRYETVEEEWHLHPSSQQTTTAALEQQPPHSGVDIPLSHASIPSSPRWSYGRLENWIVNKSSVTLYLGSYLHLVAGATLLTLIFLAILALLLLTNADLMLNSNRAGYLGLSCIPFLFAFTGKNSIITYITGISHHRINQAHRFLGLSLFILISVHMGCMFHVWRPWKFLLAQQLETPKVRYGLATYTTLCLIVLTAAWPVRRWAYEVFVLSHTLFLVFIVLVGFHTPYAMRFTAAGIFVYVVNVLTGWCVKTRTAFAQATVFQDRLTRLRMDIPVFHSPGQHIYVCVPSISLIQWHPFTISSADESSVTVHARAVGGFTKKLCRWPENTQKRVILAGPYGESIQVGRRLDTHKVVFVAAGSGLAFIIPILMDLLQHRRLQTLSNCPIEIVWCVRDPDEVLWFQDELEMALDAAHGYLDSIESDKEDVDLITPDALEMQIRLLIHYTLTFGDQESLVVPAPTPPTSLQSQSSALSTKTATTTMTPAKVALSAAFAGDDRVEWVKSRLDVPAYVKKQIQGTPRDQLIEIVGCGPPLLLAEMHNAVGAEEELSGCRVNLHTERFYM
ncbi:hypothetical protein BGZ54_008975 [Gamsiella multidivaricata]|nr:hypothetical protein BGZ54_008975 [Gamsiella multidivaricata]